MLTLLATVAVALPVPQDLPRIAASPQMRFVDFSRDLERIRVSVVVGRLGAMREGKRERIPEGGVLGSGSSRTSISGTQYYRVPVRTRLEKPEHLAGVEPPSRVDLAFDLQLARLPDGSERRQSRTPSGAPLSDGMLALWVVEKPLKGRSWEMVHVIAFDPVVDDGEDPERVFTDRMRDFTTINQRIADLRAALAATEDVEREDRTTALERLRAVAEQDLEMLDPQDDALLMQHVGPLAKRVRERIATLEKDG